MSNADLADFAPKGKMRVRPGMAGLIRDAVAWAFVLALLAFVVPKFEAIFRDFGLELGGLQMLIVRASRFSSALAAGVVALLAVDSIVREALASRAAGRGLACTWSALMISLPLTTIAALIVGLSMTLTGLLSRLSG